MAGILIATSGEVTTDATGAMTDGMMTGEVMAEAGTAGSED